MKLTKLKLVQMVLSAIDSDNVTAVSETIESEQVGIIVDTIYDDLNGEFPWAHLREKGVLEVTATDHQMKIPDGVMTLNDVYYNKTLISFIEPEEMTELLFSRDTDDDNVDENGAYTDRDPIYWTSYDDTYVIFDAYDGTLASALTVTDVYRMPVQMTEDDDYPDLPERFHNAIFEGAVADAMYTLKGDVTGFNIYRNRYKKTKILMDRWAKRVNRQKSTGYNVNYGRKIN